MGADKGALRLTTARDFTPSGRSIQAKGIEPDIKMLQEVPADLKARTHVEGEASLRGHLVYHMITASARKGLIFAAASSFLGLTMLPGLAQTKKLGDGLTFEGAGASFIGSGQTTNLNCAGGGAHILGSDNTLTLTGACKWLDMVGSNNIVFVTFGNGANIEFAGSNNAITWTSADGKEPVVRHVGSGNTLTAGQ
jgi:Protein of unknown function (DUF3060)/Peptidase family S41